MVARYRWGGLVVVIPCFYLVYFFASRAMQTMGVISGLEVSYANPILFNLSRMQNSVTKKQARENLLAGIKEPCSKTQCVFDNIEPFLTAPPNFIRHAKSSEGMKTMLNPEIMFSNLTSPCIVYGLGIAGDSSFEEALTTYCEVHAFDCTISSDAPSVFGKPFKFHQICLGSKTNINESTYFRREAGEVVVFQSLEETMNQLGHKKVDVLKFDIEGSEWNLFNTILKTPPSHLPEQIFFELHTEGANRHYVPASTVHGQKRPEVNNLFLSLLDIGYWVFSKIINAGDSACAEFSLVKLPNISKSH